MRIRYAADRHAAVPPPVLATPPRKRARRGPRARRKSVSARLTIADAASSGYLDAASITRHQTPVVTPATKTRWRNSPRKPSMRRVVVKPPWFPQYSSRCRDTSIESPERAPRPKAGLAEATSTHPPKRRFIHGGAIFRTRTSRWRLPRCRSGSGPYVPSIRSVPVGSRHPKLILEAWKRVPPSRYRFPERNPFSERGRAPARARAAYRARRA